MRTISLAAALLLTVAVPSLAQTAVTFDEAAARAVAQNPTIRAARAAADRTAAEVDQVRAAWFPRLSFTESARRGDQPVFVFSSALPFRPAEDGAHGIIRVWGQHSQSSGNRSRCMGGNCAPSCTDSLENRDRRAQSSRKPERLPAHVRHRSSAGGFRPDRCPVPHGRTSTRDRRCRRPPSRSVDRGLCRHCLRPRALGRRDGPRR